MTTSSDPTVRCAIPDDVLSYGDLAEILSYDYEITLSQSDVKYIEDLERRFLANIQTSRTGAGSCLQLGTTYFEEAVGRTRFAGDLVLVNTRLLAVHVSGPSRTVRVARVFTEAALRKFCDKQTDTVFASIVDIDGSLGSASPLPPEVSFLDDGIFSGRTVEGLLQLLQDRGVTVRTIYSVIARCDAIQVLVERLASKTGFTVLGTQYRAGWDHTRDLIGIHGLRLQGGSYVPYWNIPRWISLTCFDRDHLVSICKASFAELSDFLYQTHRIRFRRDGLSLRPERD